MDVDIVDMLNFLYVYPLKKKNYPLFHYNFHLYFVLLGFVSIVVKKNNSVLIIINEIVKYTGELLNYDFLSTG